MHGRTMLAPTGGRRSKTPGPTGDLPASELPRMSPRVCGSVLVLTLTLAAVGSRAASIPVVATGTSSRPLGLPFSSFSNVSMMADGRVAFLGSSTGAFRRADDGVAHLVAAGDVLADGAVVAGVSAPALGPGDCAVVRAFLVGGGSRILRWCQTGTDVVVATGETAPDGGTFAEFVAGVGYGAQGHVAFTAILDDGSTGLFRDIRACAPRSRAPEAPRPGACSRPSA